MELSTIIDVVVVTTVLLAIVAGAARGAGRFLGTLAGAAGGLVLALALLPGLLGRFDEFATRGAILVVGTALLVALGSALGGLLGSALRRGLEAIRAGWLDNLAGAVVAPAVMAMVWVLAAGTAPALGNPDLTDAMRRSRALPPLSAAAPQVIRDVPSLPQILAQNQPVLADVIGAPTTPPALPDVAADSPQIQQALASVVRIHGSAKGCSGQVHGSGFVVGPERVVTNAHVVSGVDQPIVQVRGELAATGEVVHLDRRNDLAVIAVPGLTATPLPISRSPQEGAEAVVAGYPGAAGLTVGAARLLGAERTRVSIGGSSTVRPIQSVAAVVEQGSSGGPVLETDGEVAGVIFAKAVEVDRLAYAAPVSVLRPLARKTAGMTSPVETGRCSR